MNKLLISTFLSGILTLGIEIVCGRLLTPFLGSSLHQWAALIGIVLLAYVTGYAWFRTLNRWGPALPFAVGGLYILTFPLWLFSAMKGLLGLSLALASVTGALISAGVPSFFWASILPYLQSRSGPEGSARVLVWSTLGNLAGAWGVAFLAVPYLGTRGTLIVLGALSLVLAIFWLIETPLVRNKMALGSAAACLLAAPVLLDRAAQKSELLPTVPRRPDVALIESRDSGYQNIAVWDEGPPDDRRRVLSLDGNLQFRWKPTENLTEGDPSHAYYNYSTAAALWNEQARPAKRTLILGLGGGLIPWQLHRFFPDMKIVVYELDRIMAETTQTYLPLAKAGEVEVRLGDGRVLLRNDPDKYDYILIDTFLSGFIPFHLTTKEFFEIVQEHLTPGGIVVANFHTVFARSGLLPKIEATLGSVFPSVGAIDLPIGTSLVIATNQTVDLYGRLSAASLGGPEELRELHRDASVLLRRGAQFVDVGGELLSDDRNDTEQRLYETRRLVF